MLLTRQAARKPIATTQAARLALGECVAVHVYSATDPVNARIRGINRIGSTPSPSVVRMLSRQ